MGKGRPPSFQFYPRDFIASTSVSLMSPEERGGYIMLLCHAWESAEHGILPNDDKALSRLSGLGDRWPECREAIARAFTVTDDHWVQERMVEERGEQAQRYAEAQEGGKKRAESMTPEERTAFARSGAHAKWALHRASIEQAGRLASDASGMLTPASASASASASKSKASTVIADAITPSPDGEVLSLVPQVPKTEDPAKRLRKDWRDAFSEHFWPAYPRKVGKGAALKAWERCYPKGGNVEDEFNRILDGLERWKAVHRDAEPEFIPHPSTWLNQSRWEDEAV